MSSGATGSPVASAKRAAHRHADGDCVRSATGGNGSVALVDGRSGRIGQ
jgi:hypothetical protein